MAKLNLQTIPTIPVGDIISGIQTGEHIIEVAYPVIKDLFTKVSEWIKGLQSDELSTPHGKRKHIEALEVKDKLQQKLNKIHEAAFKQLGVDITTIVVE